MSSAGGGRDSLDGRLPRDLFPYHYDIDITPDFYRPEPPFPFNGTVSISFDCVQSTNVLTVNVYQLSVTSVTVSVSPDSETTPPTPTVTGWTIEEAADFLHIDVLNAFLPGAKYIATISYTGFVSIGTGYGFYADSYEDPDDGSTVFVISDINYNHISTNIIEPWLKTLCVA